MSLTRPEGPRYLVGVIAPALAGLVFCLLNAAGAELLCVTSGCRLYAGYTLFGLSFYVYGAAWFAAVLLLAAGAGRRPALRSLLFAGVLAGLGADTLFLAWQVLYWPCLSCLAAAALLGATAGGSLLAFPDFRRGLLKTSLTLWLVAFIPVAAAASKEVLITPWPLYGPADAEIRVFFSPTCPACAAAVRRILDHPELAGRAALFPVAKNAEDGRRLARLLQDGALEPEEIAGLFEAGPAAEAPPPDRSLRLRLARNKMALARTGADTLPLILSPTVFEAAPDTVFGVSQPFALGTSSWGEPPVEGCGAVETPGEECD